MRKWQRGRKPKRKEPPNPEGPPLQPAYPELSGPQPPDVPEEHAAAQTAAPGAPQRRKRGGRRRSKPAQPQPGPEQAPEKKTPPQQPKPVREKTSKPARGRGRRGGARKPARAAEPPMPVPEVLPLQPAYPELAEAEPVPPAETAPEIVQEPLPTPPSKAEPLPEPESELATQQAAQSAPDFAPELTTTVEPPPQPAPLPAPAPLSRPQRAPKGVVVLAVGLPGSGKTTWFKRRGVTPLSSDLLRTLLFDNITEQRYQNLVFGTLRSLLRARLIARMPWNYVDATNLSPKERRHWIQMARDFGFEVHAVFFDVPLEVCLERNRRRERVVPQDVMQRMAAKLRPPRFEEGFTKITVVRVKKKEGQA